MFECAFAHIRFNQLSRWLALGCALFFVGCGDGDRHPISGTVKLNGQPVAKGSISFRPAKGKTGNTAGAVIVEGEYAIPSERGLAPGHYLVQIETYFKTGHKIKDPQKGIVDVEKRVDYIEQGKLTATITPSQHSSINFDITSPLHKP